MPLDALVAGRVATFAGDAGFGFVEAVGIKDGKIAFAGSAVDLESRADPHTQRFELEPGEIAIPGLIDAHLHVAEAALEAERVNLSPAATIEDGLAAVRAFAATLAGDEWIEGAGWDHRRWGRWPTAADLETAAPGRKVALWSFDHHGLWVSAAALADAGIDAAFAEPEGGLILRDDDGSPIGVLLENATRIVNRRIPPPSEATVERALAALARELIAVGVVGAHDPGVLTPDKELRMLGLYGRLADRGALPIRVHAGIRADGLDRALERGLRTGDRLGEDATGDRARVGWLKLFADGTLAARTAALLDPLDGPAAEAGRERGVFSTPPDVLASFAEQAAAGGIATMIHAIGDAAVRAALDAVGPTSGQVGAMPRLEHIQLCHPDDRARFGRLGVAASVQPVHLRDDADTARRDWGDRAEAWAYTWHSLMDAGATVAFGTDAPVEPIDPWPGIAMAVLRRDPSWGADAAVFGPDERLTLDQALRAATIAPAVVARDGLRGRLVPGSPADLIVLPAAPRERDEAVARFAAVRPRLVLIDGEVALER